MHMAFGRSKNQINWQPVINSSMGVPMQFIADKGLMEFLVEKMQEKYPNIEYKLEEVK